VEFLGRAWAEPELIRLAFGFEQATHLRKPPVSAPVWRPPKVRNLTDDIYSLDLRRFAR
jgi:hypothetical protein